MWNSSRVFECGVSVYSQRVYSTRPLFSTVGHQSCSWSKQSWRMFRPSASITYSMATCELP